MEREPDSSLIIGVATSTAERVQLARLLGDADALLLVSSAEQARIFLEFRGSSAAAQVGLPPTEVMPPVVGLVEEPMAVVEKLPRSAQIESAAQPAGLSLDVDRRVVRWNDREVPLTRLEHDFLHCLVAEPGQVWTYQRLHLVVWGNEYLGHGSHIHSVVKRLRRKLARVGAAVTIHAVRGVGFHLVSREGGPLVA
jgi:DNA-binding response OmpR family regulator